VQETLSVEELDRRNSLPWNLSRSSATQNLVEKEKEEGEQLLNQRGGRGKGYFLTLKREKGKLESIREHKRTGCLGSHSLTG